MPYYCLKCKRVFLENDKCKFCNNEVIKPLKINSPVNVIGSKIKGKITKINSEECTLLIVNEANERNLKVYNINEIRKII